jgi:hypothetical protein
MTHVYYQSSSFVLSELLTTNNAGAIVRCIVDRSFNFPKIETTSFALPLFTSNFTGTEVLLLSIEQSVLSTLDSIDRSAVSASFTSADADKAFPIG